MNWVIRPSKAFLFDQLEKYLKDQTGAVAIDAASANFKNRRMFKTDKYYGIDRDANLLREGLAKYPDDRTFGISADIAKLDLLADNSVDVVVSTKTLYQLDRDARKAALHHLCRICSPTGSFFCELFIDQDFDDTLAIIRSYFSDVKVAYYRNPVSRLYESIFEREGDLGSHPIAGARPFRLFSWLISHLEFLTKHSRRLNRNAFLICKNKQGRASPERFDLNMLSTLEDRIYQI